MAADTPPPLSAADVAEIQALYEKATPGEWTAESRHVQNPENDPAFGEQSGLGWDIEGPPEPILRGQFSSGYDARLLVALHNAWPRIRAALDRQSAALERARVMLTDLRAEIEDIRANAFGSLNSGIQDGAEHWRRGLENVHAKCRMIQTHPAYALSPAAPVPAHKWVRQSPSLMWWCDVCKVCGGNSEKPANIGPCCGYDRTENLEAGEAP